MAACCHLEMLCGCLLGGCHKRQGKNDVVAFQQDIRGEDIIHVPVLLGHSVDVLAGGWLATASQFVGA